MKLITGNPFIMSRMRPSAVTSAGSGRLRALSWLSATALVGMLSACAINAPDNSSTGGVGGKIAGEGTCEHDVCEAGAALDPTCDACAASVCDVDSFCCEVEWDSVCVGLAEETCGLNCGLPTCEHDLCEAGAPLDPSCDPCVESICLQDPSCCEGNWGPSCIALADQICGLDCQPGGNCEHPLCEAGAPLDPTCDACANTVCTTDSFCCEVEWDIVCVDLAEQLCGIECGGGNCEHDLCEVGGPLEPGCDECVTDVCNADSFCCEVEWDQICIDEAVAICGLDCGGGGNCEHELCEVGAPLDPTCDTCVNDVCTADSFCCEVEWDQLCIDLAVAICGLDCGGGGDCAHDLCDVGVPLDPTCDTCVNDVCTADSFCCEVEWDQLCIDQAVAICGLDCGGGGDCAHDLCDVGVPLDPTCDTCVNDVCTADSFCCEVEWDQVCVDLAVQVCGLDCGGGTCEHELCEEGNPLDPTCDPCVTEVCNVDSFCCETAWDEICIGEAEEICGIDCGGEPPIECGNNVCEFGEHCLSCPEDCGECPECPHDVCEEGSAMPFGCDTCVPNICKVDSFCCEVAWDSICIDEVEQHCARDCN